MIPRLSLTVRLTGLFTLTTAVVLLGLGSLILVAVEHHFLELDRATLQDKFHLIKEVGSKSSSMADFQARLASVLHSHKDLSARVQSDTTQVYATAGLQLPTEWLQAKASNGDEGLFTWNADGVRYRGTRGVIPSLDGTTQSLQVWVAVNTQHHASFMADFQKWRAGNIVQRAGGLVCGKKRPAAIAGHEIARAGNHGSQARPTHVRGRRTDRNG